MSVVEPGGAQLFDRTLRAQALGFLFVAGSFVGTLTLVFPHDDAVKDGPLYALAVVATVTGVLLITGARSVSERGLHAVLAFGTLILAASNYFVGVGALYPMIYSWTALYAFTCFPMREALAHMALITVASTVVVVIQDPPSPVTRSVLALGTPLVTGLFISRLLERVRREAAHTTDQSRVLSESEARTRAIVEAAPEAFMTVAEDGSVLSWNRAAEKMFQWPAEEAIGRGTAELLFSGEASEAHDERRRRAFEELEDGASARYEVELARRDGSRFPAELTVSPVRAGDSRLLAAFLRDLSDRDQQERERSELYREQAAREEAERMAGVVQGLQMLLDAALAHRRLDSMLLALVPRLREVLSADAAAVMLAEEDGSLTVGAATGAGEDELPLRLAPGEGIASRAAASGEPLLVQDPPPEDVAVPALRGMSSILCVPLLAGGTVTGVIEVGVDAPKRFADDDILLMGLAADRVALALDHARVYEREHRIAETLQRSLLPDRLPTLAGLEVAARYLAAASEAEVGGDWYDVIPIDTDRVGLVMGDVAGKGLAAASMVGRLRSAMRAYALEGHDVAGVVDRLNQLVWSEGEESQMATLVYLVVDQGEMAVTWVNAGHLPPLVMEGDGPRFLEGPSSVPLGVMPYATYEGGSMELAPGATFLLYTDGLIERPGELLDDGLARLADTVRHAGMQPEALCEEVLTRLVPGGAAPDDVALLALHSPALTERFSLEVPPFPGELASLRALLRRWLRQTEGSEEEVAEILTAAGEAAANAIEHGGDAGGPFEVAGVVTGDEVDLTIRDRGSWRPKSEDRGGGRGLILMRELMDSVEVTPGPEGTTVRMRRRLSNGGPVG